MKTKTIAVVGLLAVVLSASMADACQRCGLFGRRCRFQQVHHVQKVQAVHVPVVVEKVVEKVVEPSQTITIQNNYNGAGLSSPLAQQGQSVYGYSQAAAAYSLDPNQILATAARLTENAQALADEGLSGYNATAQLSLTQHGEVAKILAASQHLRAAVGTGSSSQSITVRTGSGKARVATDPPLPPAETLGMPAVFRQSCVRCHSGAAPKGQFSLDLESYDPATITRALRAIATGAMPPADETALTTEAKGQIMSYLLNNETGAQ